MATETRPQMSEKEKRGWSRLHGDILTLCLASMANKDGAVRDATRYLMETINEIADAREVEVRRTLSVLRSNDLQDTSTKDK